MTHLPIFESASLKSAGHEFAVSVVQRLRSAGFEALWAGGCVRDALLNKLPKDYDVATSATPDQVTRLFGPRRTVAVGASFGVIMVLGPAPEAGQVEVATFRCDGAYRDGRRPESVRFSTPEDDARRRDFTINGMFYDPIAHRVIDFVGGLNDLEQRQIRAIGNPAARFAEDKLRMLRAVRFAAALQFELDPATFQAITTTHTEILQVSAERISQELRRMLADPHRGIACELLRVSGLLLTLFPGLNGATDSSLPTTKAAPQEAQMRPTVPWLLWDAAQVCRALSYLEDASYESSFALLLSSHLDLAGKTPGKRVAGVRRACQRFKLANAETEAICWLVDACSQLKDPADMPRHQLKPLLSHALTDSLLAMNSAIAAADGHRPVDADFCRRYLSQTAADVLNPPALVTGRDLMELGISPGPRFSQILNAVRVQQLEERIVTRSQAVTFIQSELKSSNDQTDA